MEIKVCVGSSCHLRGSYDIINCMKEAIDKNGLSEQVELKAAFCLGKCTNGVSVQFDDEIVTGVSMENFEQVFQKHVLNKGQ